ncbi:hydroxyneurosporene synthase [Fusarium pseudocircinatum]|uniref:Hydroxyneurosporene synthase n=1 Tax=Fusarium pseudocircinatum TaxID=56676 RepID=A0A8H5NMN9_9HYPO|nr:hydroxyneurosporene synthase [Fusarium pseudocircinatum]
MYQSFLLSLVAFSGLGFAKPFTQVTKTFSFPFKPHEGVTTVEGISRPGRLDWPKLSPGPNATTFDWWYFDAVSKDTNETIVIVADLYGNDTLGLPTFGGGTTVGYIAGNFANGTLFESFGPATSGTTVKAGPKGINGDWKEAGIKFEGSSLELPYVTYTVTIDSPSAGISAPHYPCGLNTAGQNQEIVPGVYWANAQPDAIATADFVVHNERVAFEGYGYHDKNWGSDNLRRLIRTWYWGHGRVGPYSIVWFDTLDQHGKKYYSSWITKNGKVVAQSCKDKAVVVEPWGGNTQFPPEPKAAPPNGYTISYDLGDNKAFWANFTREVDHQVNDIYRRFSGSLCGGIVGGKQYEGRAMAEQFQHPALST